MRGEVLLRRHSSDGADPGAIRLPYMRNRRVGDGQRPDSPRAWAGTGSGSGGARSRRGGGAVPQTPRRIRDGQVPRLRQADLPEVHGAFRLCLLAVVPGQGRGERHCDPCVCRAEVGAGGAEVAAGAVSDARPSASRMARRRRSRSSCTSTINNSNRLSPMTNRRRARRLDNSTSWTRLAVPASMA